MKKWVVAVALFACVWNAWGLSVPIGERRTLALGFEPESFFVSAEGRDCIQVTLPPAGDRVSIEGKRVGRCSVTFYENGAERAREDVTVTSGLAELRRSLARRLEELADVAVEEERDKLVVTGVVRKPADWTTLEKVLAMDMYRGKVENLVTFQVDRPTIEGLKRKIQGMGFRLTEGYPQSIGTLQMVYEDNILTIAGTVYSKSDLVKLRRLIEMQSWLKMVDTAAETGSGRRPTATCVMNVGVDRMEVELTAVIMAVSENASREIGADAPTIQPFYEAFYDFIRGPHHGTKEMRISASIANTLTALARNGIMRGWEKASMRFHLNQDGDEASRVKWGGTMKLKLATTDGNGNVNLSYEDVEYGFSLKKLSARRVSADTVELKLQIEQRTQPVPRADAWDMEEHVYNPVVTCKLGETVIIGGYEKMLEQDSLPDGLPVLRHVPILNWFVSKEGHVDEDKTMLMAISVDRARTAAVSLALPEDITQQVNTPNDERLKEKRRFRGCWTPLNWLTW